MENNWEITLPKEVEDAFLLMEKEEPKYPEELLQKLGAYLGTNEWAKQGKPFFRGWTGQVDGCTRYDATTWGRMPQDLSKISYFGIWTCRTMAKTIAWCVIPSMNHGNVLPGEIIDAGDPRIAPGQYSQEELDAMVVKGWEVIQQLIDVSGRYEA